MNEELIASAIDKYGKEKQSIVCMEECCELAQAVSKELRGKHNKDHLVEEIADVTICIEMLKQMYAISENEIDRWIEAKQNRMLKRMQAGE